ncbi:MAG: efflux RND transporter periplasmic adaptor subunit [Isosphaeraceae bacterium]
MGFWKTGALLGLITVALAAIPYRHQTLPYGGRSLEGVSKTLVRRNDISVTMTASGRVDSSKRTIIYCQLENLAVNVRGQGITAGGASTILSVIPDGSEVKEGDVLCILDASGYEDLLVAQSMNVDRAKADLTQATLNLDVARMAIDEYRDGLMRQTQKTLEGNLALVRSDLERSNDRLLWSRRMLRKGYLSPAQVSTEESQRLRLSEGLNRDQSTLRLFKTFSAPIYLRILESDVLSATTTKNYQELRVQRTEDRLARLRKQVERCTIRAPHDGFLIYANEPWKKIQIETGMFVRQRQRLFYLPDLTQMEVTAMLHESVVKDVKPGMLASVRIEGAPQQHLEGHVVSLAQLPTQNMLSEVKYYGGIIKLDSVPKGVKPGMSAEVEIQTVSHPDVLTVPAEALAVEEGHDVCYVTHDQQIERREVKLGQATRDFLEVTEGLKEGEEVLLDPTHMTSPVHLATEAEETSPPAESIQTH